ncbi:MAG: XRE family transcriptional regulator [Xanthomonadales bacterium]|nr:helix-turn-helix domain-containing protein [Gammaproteobacteria bacterium]NNK04639.1 XRE family transcriptional regulator [Xanthomonadales bacterium]
MLNGKPTNFSLDALIKMLASLGGMVELKVA